MPSVYAYFSESARTGAKHHADQPKKLPVVLMVSGGADSVAMLMRILRGEPVYLGNEGAPQPITRERINVLHVNHGIRGLAAQEDSEFVAHLAQAEGVSCKVVEVDAPAFASKHKCGVEAAARELRYKAAQSFAQEIAQRVDAKARDIYICTAHTADDVAETFLMHTFKGAGAAGLSGIASKRKNIVRPFLTKTHEENCAYLRDHADYWQEDETNADTSYFRNFVRHKVLAPAREYDPKIPQNIQRTSELIAQEDRYLRRVTAEVTRPLVLERSATQVVIDATRLRALDMVLARRFIREELCTLVTQASLTPRFSLSHTESVLKLVADQAGTKSLPHYVFAEVAQGCLTLSYKDPEQPSRPIDEGAWLSVPGFVEVEQGVRLESVLLDADKTLQMSGERSNTDLARSLSTKGPGVAVMDALKVGKLYGGDKPLLWVTRPHPGDTMQPFGMDGHTTSVSKVLRAHGVPPAQTQNQLVVRVNPRGSILSIVSIRTSDLVCVDASTTHLLVLQCTRER